MSQPTPDKSLKLPFTVPTWLIYLLVLMVVASWIPLALIARARASKSPRPQVHIFLDMDKQPRFGPQSYTGADDHQLGAHYGDLFADRRGMRPPVPGTVARNGHAGPRLDAHYNFGYAINDDRSPRFVSTAEGNVPEFFAGLPESVKLDRALLERGRQRYDIYCSVCHGKAGYGDGSVARYIDSSKASASMTGAPDPAAGWAVPRNLHQSNVVGIGEGRLFHVISDGFGNMRGYKEQVSVADRWAIVAYVKALQASQNVSVAYATTTAGMTAEQVEALTEAAGPQPEKMKAAEDPTALIEQGKVLFTTKICATCHETPGVPAPPTGVALKAPAFVGKFWGQTVTVTEGPGGPEREVIFDTDYVIESIEFPMKLIHKGSIAAMAPFPTTPDERKALAAYIQSLSE